jgi:hypothetical protein
MTHAIDPATWLSEFEAVGGGWIVRDCLWLLIQVGGQSDAELSTARQLVVDLTPEHRAAIIAHLRASEEG